MNTCKNFVDSVKNADFTGIFRLIMKEPSYNKTIHDIDWHTGWGSCN